MDIRIESTNKPLSSLGGLFLYEKIIDQVDLEGLLSDLMPVKKIIKAKDYYQKFQTLIYASISGANCLEDTIKYSADPGFEAITKGTHKPNTYGRFLRDFTDLQAKELNKRLILTSLKLRKASHPNSRNFVLDIDSTFHYQSGDKMEGLKVNYEGDKCLSSIQAYDELGYSYWNEVRHGSAATHNGSETIIHEVSKQLPKKQKMIVRADSGYHQQSFFNSCLNAGAQFIVAMRRNIFNPYIKRVYKWHPSKLRTKDGRECEIGSTVYYHKGVRKPIRIVALRSLKKNPQGDLFEPEYDYFPWATTIGQHEMRDEKIILLYRKRGHAENMIRENKNGYDLHHLPCQSLIANKIYALIATYAFTLMRYTSFLLNRKNPYFSKMIRFRMVSLACEVVTHARYVTFRYFKPFAREVNTWLTTILRQFRYV